jgi:hypothetical protein
VVDPVLGEFSCSVALVLIELLALAAVCASVEENIVGCDLLTIERHEALRRGPFELILLTFNPNSVGLEVVVVVLDRAPGVVQRSPLL